MRLSFIALAGAAIVLTSLPAGFVSTADAQKRSPVQCMTDDGYGRYRPCSSGYKRSHPNWRNGPECMTDDGYGRYRPCSSGFMGGPPPTPGKK